ncbi:hypothetical protein OPV22_032135 [Ensete ventricosum]|uniref:Uncharacterized protein n=1 Tax=Ensete ventricosum TaxID=4639 RepID=A0AAV8PYF7_ENSVE|nr:hypothetical protein OPV22_032135 [Ensete ventricosum]
MLDSHLFVALPQPLAAGDHDAVGVNVADVVDLLVVEADRSVFLQHPVGDVDHAAVGNAAAAVGAGLDGRAVAGSVAGREARQPEAVAVEGAPPGGGRGASPACWPGCGACRFGGDREARRSTLGCGR